MKSFYRFFIVFVLSFMFWGTAHSTIISNFAPTGDSITPFGLPNTGSYGQTFQMGAENTLNSFAFKINDKGSAITFDALVFEWNGSEATGAELFRTSGSTSGTDAFAVQTVSTGNLVLNTGTTYIAFLQATAIGAAEFMRADAGDTTFPFGGFAFLNNGSNESLWTTGGWVNGQQDFQFEIEVSAIPLPTSVLLFGTGLLGLVVWRRKSRHS